jgi:hypothetical protein
MITLKTRFEIIEDNIITSISVNNITMNDNN